MTQDLRRLWERSIQVDDLESLQPGLTYKPAIGDNADLLTSPDLDPAQPRFELGEEVGAGGMGVVLRATQRSLNREVALKLAHGADDDPDWTRRFLAEARVTGYLDHPNIVPAHDLTRDEDGRLMFAMKLVGGRSWDRLIYDADPQHDLEWHLEVLLSVCNAVAFAHSRGIAHCDLKPSNVMVGEFGEVLVMDWGLALDLRETPPDDSPARRRKQLNGPCGTPSYLSPEQANGDGAAIGTWTDTYLLGGILYCIVTGDPPHLSDNVWAAVLMAVSSTPPIFDESVPEPIQTICTRAMARLPEDRYQQVAEFASDVRDYLRHRESLAITHQAEQSLAQTTDAVEEAAARYAHFAAAVAGFDQALLLWSENARAEAGLLDARLRFARAAITNGEPGLARAQLQALGPTAEAGVRTQLETSIATLEATDRRVMRNLRLFRLGLAAAVVIIGVGVLISFLAVNAERDNAEAHASLAEHRLADIRRLADHETVESMEKQAANLWPALPRNVGDMRTWLTQAKELIGRLDGHLAYVDRLRQEKGTLENGVWRFATPADHWEHRTFTELITWVSALRDDLVPDVQRRLQFARTVHQKTIADRRAEWGRAAARIAGSPRYRGLKLAPQIGLIPLGPDPRTGLEEFAHLQSGSVPARDAEGRLLTSADTAIVLVLLPAGTFQMGAADATASETERPVHPVTLSAFFMAKTEVTQGQWVRFLGQNPAAYADGREIGGKTVTLEHPVEQVKWRHAHDFVTHLDLTLPTEAQWEYATRAGTTTVFWTGDDKTSLQGATNLCDRYAREHDAPSSWRFEPWMDDGYTVHAPVGRYRANAFGLHDTAGNVWEWVADRFASYTAPTAAGSGMRTAAPDAPRVFRGGGFRATAVHARSSERYKLYAPDYRAYDVGLRAARAIDP